MNTPCVRCSNAIHTFFSLSSSPVFHKLQGDQAVLQKVVYVLANLVGVGLAVYKFNNMGLLPTAQSDWLEFMEARQVSPALGSCFNVINQLATSFINFVSPSGFGNVRRRISTCVTVHLHLHYMIVVLFCTVIHISGLVLSPDHAQTAIQKLGRILEVAGSHKLLYLCLLPSCSLYGDDTDRPTPTTCAVHGLDV